MDRRATV